LFDNPLKPWKAVREVLNLENEGNSIFKRKKPLVENTLKRIYAGLIKFVANGDDIFLKKYYSGRPAGKVVSVNGPAGTITTVGNQGIVNVEFLQSYYRNGNAHSTDEPCPTVTTKDRFSKVEYLMLNYSNGDNVRSVDGPAATIVNNDKHNLIKAESFLFNPQFKNPGNSVDKPCPVIIARQDKKPLGLVICEQGEGFAIPVYEDDCETMVKIKIFMAYYGIIDIKMRMLEVEELLQIQGFPKDYKLVGNQTDKKKFIGNSVEVTTAKKIFEAHHESLIEYFESKKAA